MIPVAILGATGSVGQKAIHLLEGHSRFFVAEVAASERHVGKRYGEMEWREEGKVPAAVRDLPLKSAVDVTSPYVLSGLPARAALDIEPLLVGRGLHVISNASAHRMRSDVPLLIPEINVNHLELLKKQNSVGKLVTNPNCVVAVVAPALAPLLRLGVIEHVGVTTLQAVSGAGYPGLSSLDILGNVIPHIEGEEAKIESEIGKILGHPGESAAFSVTAQVHRVPVLHGHLAALQVRMSHPIAIQALRECYLASALYCVHEELSAPQPGRHLGKNDMRVHIGRLRSAGSVLCLVAMGHNLVRGAAGAAIANLEATERFLPKDARMPGLLSPG